MSCWWIHWATEILPLRNHGKVERNLPPTFPRYHEGQDHAVGQRATQQPRVSSQDMNPDTGGKKQQMCNKEWQGQWQWTRASHKDNMKWNSYVKEWWIFKFPVPVYFYKYIYIYTQGIWFSFSFVFVCLDNFGLLLISGYTEIWNLAHIAPKLNAQRQTRSAARLCGHTHQSQHRLHVTCISRSIFWRFDLKSFRTSLKFCKLLQKAVFDAWRGEISSWVVLGAVWYWTSGVIKGWK